MRVWDPTITAQGSLPPVTLLGLTLNEVSMNQQGVTVLQLRKRIVICCDG